MKVSFNFLFIILASGILGACNHDGESKDLKFKEVTVEAIPDDFLLPSKLWDLMEDKKIDSGKEKEPKEGESKDKKEGGEEKSESGKGDGKKNTIQTKENSLAEVNVYLYEKNPGVVKDSAVKISLPKGGGEIDLAKYLTDVSGSFYFRIEYSAFDESIGQKVFFQSRARKRRLDDKVWGSGCSVILDITKAFKKDMAKSGLKLNTTRQRHITVIGGTFFLSAKTETGYLVSQVTIKDSKHPNLFCEAP